MRLLTPAVEWSKRHIIVVSMFTPPCSYFLLIAQQLAFLAKNGIFLPIHLCHERSTDQMLPALTFFLTRHCACSQFHADMEL